MFIIALINALTIADAYKKATWTDDQGNSSQARIKAVAQRIFTDEHTGKNYQFTWRTISTWLYRFKKHGMTTLDNKTQSDKNTYRKVQLNE